eukprot:2309505-Lingulodinium_polyedra.AAC.1
MVSGWGAPNATAGGTAVAATNEALYLAAEIAERGGGALPDTACAERARAAMAANCAREVR